MAGVIDLKRSLSPLQLTSTAKAMGDCLRHRGPDEDGEWVAPDSGVALVHRRLSIIDLSPSGRQPMRSTSGRYVISYNGEIYNYRQLRRELEGAGVRFRGDSDTEVLLEAVERWGLEPALARLIGMFAIALWDTETRTLSLVRDRIGIKPLYWGRMAGRFLFASELSALAAVPGFRREVDRTALTALVAYNYVPGPLSIYEGTQQLRPGHLLVLDADGRVEERCYWDLAAIAEAATAAPRVATTEAFEEIAALIETAVADRLVADVPVGAFLSGGIDSSSVVSAMQAAASGPVKTFSIGFKDDAFDEAAHARRIAGHLGTEHHEQILTNRDALDLIPKLPTLFSEPFADSSQIPTYLVSALAQRHVKVVLSGDGGDEVFAGYNRYLAAVGIWPRLAPLPLGLRKGLAGLLAAVPARSYDRLGQVLPRRHRISQVGDKMLKLTAMLRSPTLADFYGRVVQLWDDAASAVVGGTLPAELERSLMRRVPEPVHGMQLVDMLTYLPGDILTKVDRASMAVGLEARVPLLDHRLVEAMWAIPPNMKIREGETKWLLRRFLERRVPRSLTERPKMGFAVPIGDWLRGPLRDWAEDLLSPSALSEAGLFHAQPIRERWQRHLSGHRNEEHALWSILMAQAWQREWVVKASSEDG